MSIAPTYIAIDLKSFYASVECVDRGLDPLDVNLVVADKSRTDKTICLAVSPSLKQHGVGGRARLFEVIQRVREVNNQRRWQSPTGSLSAKSISASQLKQDPTLELDYLVAPPRMARYIEYSSRIYQIYLKYIAPEDIHIYSIDEVFIDASAYLETLHMDAHQLAMTIIRDVLSQTGITATAGLGTNLYLAKIAMDIVAKKMPADKDGVRIAQLDEASYRQMLWSHTPLTDFWRVGRGITQRLAPYGVRTMGDIARLSLQDEDLLYRLLGVNAELLIDHAWGWEPVDLAEIKAYKPETNSLSCGQVLTQAYTCEQAKVVALEMAEEMALDLVRKGLVTDQIVLTIGYDVECITNPTIRDKYQGQIVKDHFGRLVPKHSHGTSNLECHTSSLRILNNATDELFDRIVNQDLLVRRLNLTANHVVAESNVVNKVGSQQLDLFTDYEALQREHESRQQQLQKERRLMETTIKLKNKYGKNALIKGLNFADGATARQRNQQIGGHKA